MDVNHEGNLAGLRKEIPYLDQFISLLNDGIIGCCKRTYTVRSGSSNIYKLEGYKIDAGNLEITSKAAGLEELGVIHLIAPAVPTSACYHGYGSQGRVQTPNEKGEWVAIANYKPGVKENRPFSWIAGPRLFRLGGAKRPPRDTKSMKEWAEHGYVEKYTDLEGRHHELTFTLASTTADLMSRVPPRSVNFKLKRTIKTDLMRIREDQFSLDLVLDPYQPFNVAQRSPGERANVTESRGEHSR